MSRLALCSDALKFITSDKYLDLGVKFLKRKHSEYFLKSFFVWLVYFEGRKEQLLFSHGNARRGFNSMNLDHF